MTGTPDRGIEYRGIEAARQRRRVAFWRAADLVRTLVEAQDAKELGRYQRRLDRVDILIVDEVGFVPFERHGGELLFNVLASRHGRRNVVITNLAFADGGDGKREVFSSSVVSFAVNGTVWDRPIRAVLRGAAPKVLGPFSGAPARQASISPGFTDVVIAVTISTRIVFATSVSYTQDREQEDQQLKTTISNHRPSSLR